VRHCLLRVCGVVCPPHGIGSGGKQRPLRGQHRPGGEDACWRAHNVPEHGGWAVGDRHTPVGDVRRSIYIHLARVV
jgi:hypothetical protein